jgi:hypothetical protein
MQVLCAYTELRPEVVSALDTTGYEVDYVDVSASLTAYWHAIKERWNGLEDLITVEQDNLLEPDMLSLLECCDEDWCCFQYTSTSAGSVPCEIEDFDGTVNKVTHITYGLGCTKFSAALQRRFPSKDIAAGDYLMWSMIDFRFKQMFHDLHRLNPHIHGDVKHLHEPPEGFDPSGPLVRY